MPTVFVRFIVHQQHEDSDGSMGIFTAAYDLSRSDEVPNYQADELIRLIDWFELNLGKPRRFNKSTSKGAWRRPGKAISWFKASAVSHITKIREIIATLEDNGYAVRMIKTRRPGYIVYEDAFQVAAEPFRDTDTG